MSKALLALAVVVSLLGSGCAELVARAVVGDAATKRAERNAEIERATGLAVPNPREAALTLTGAAMFAVRSGDCSMVEAVELHVRDLDLYVHDKFARDHAVAGCLADAARAEDASAWRSVACRKDRTAAFVRALAITDRDQRTMALALNPPAWDCFDRSTMTAGLLTTFEHEITVEHSWILTRQAAIAANAGDCTTVVSLAAQLDAAPELAAADGPQLRNDPASLRCLASPEPAPRRSIRPAADPCRERRAAYLVDANKIDDVKLRAKVLQGAPRCDDPTLASPVPRTTAAPGALPQTRARERAPSPSRVTAWARTKAARAWAAIGDCEPVRAIEPEVRAIDPGFHELVFTRDVAIARCLTTIDGATVPQHVRSAELAYIEPQVRACGAGYANVGRVKALVALAPNGRVISVTVQATPDAWLGACVRGKLQTATFAPTPAGGSFTYAIAF